MDNSIEMEYYDICVMLANMNKIPDEDYDSFCILLAKGDFEIIKDYLWARKEKLEKDKKYHREYRNRKKGK